MLEAKEGLALINGTQVSTGLALAGLFTITVGTRRKYTYLAKRPRDGERDR